MPAHSTTALLRSRPRGLGICPGNSASDEGRRVRLPQDLGPLEAPCIPHPAPGLGRRERGGEKGQPAECPQVGSTHEPSFLTVRRPRGRWTCLQTPPACSLGGPASEDGDAWLPSAALTHLPRLKGGHMGTACVTQCLPSHSKPYRTTWSTLPTRLPPGLGRITLPSLPLH